MTKRAVALIIGVLLAALTLAGCAGNTGSGPVKIATKPMTEQFITSEMLGLLIEQAGYTVEITKGIGGGTSNIQPAMEKGEFDLYTEYTGTGWLNVLGEAEVPEDGTLEEQLQQKYNEKFGFSWVGFYGFNNTYTLAVRGAVAEQYGLATMTDLATAAPGLVFGGNADFFERADGFNALCAAYGYSFGKTVDIDIGLKYQALEAGEIDVTNAFTTDAQLSVADVVTLEDDRNYFTAYYAGTVVRNDALEKYPKLRGALEKMEGILNDQEMAALSYKVEVDGMDEKQVAREFLESKDLI